MDMPDWVRRLNYIGSEAGGSKNIVSLDLDELVDLAIKQVGLSDFGADDWLEKWRRSSGMRVSYQSYTLVGAILARSGMLRTLRNRLLIVDRFKRNPEILEEPIAAPIFIVGNIRTGTTILHELLAQDPQFRTTYTWESVCPVPLPEGITASPMPVSEIAQGAIDIMMDVQPALRSMHLLAWDLPLECFCLDPLFFNLEAPGNSESNNPFKNVDAEGMYRWSKKMLQLLQFGGDRKPWLQKCSEHLHFLDSILKVFPDARFIYTHRDPVKSIPSIVSVYRHLFSIGSDSAQIHVDGRHELNKWVFGAKKAIEERESGIVRPDKIADMHFSDLMSDPVGTIRKAYDHLGIEFTEEYGEKIVAYLAEKPRHKAGKHSYSAEDCGLTETEIREKFQFYTDYYGVEVET